MWLHVGRARLQRAAEVSLGLTAGRAKDLPAAWFEALAFLEGQAEELEFQMGMDRDRAAAAQHGG